MEICTKNKFKTQKVTKIGRVVKNRPGGCVGEDVGSKVSGQHNRGASSLRHGSFLDFVRMDSVVVFSAPTKPCWERTALCWALF